MSTTSYYAPARSLAILVAGISETFDCCVEDIKMNLSGSSLLFEVVVPNMTLARINFTSDDFLHFCKNNDLHGVIWFVSDGIKFTMIPNVPAKETSTSLGLLIFPTKISEISPEIADFYANPGPGSTQHIKAIKFFREMTGCSVADAKNYCDAARNLLTPNWDK